jgi:hypothetical protein
MDCTPNYADDTGKSPDVPYSTLACVLDGVEPSLPESLFGEECRRQMHLVASRLPTRLSSFWGFECRLGEPEPSSDILFEIKKEALGPALLAGGQPSILDDLCEAYPVWEKFRSFARDWANPEHARNRDVHNLWLEMDLAGADAESVLRQPYIFFGPEQKTSNGSVFSLICELASLFERPVSGARALREFFDVMPEGARIFQIGFMLAREDDAGIRLCVDKMPPEPEKCLAWLVRLLPAMGAAEAESLKDALERIFPLCRETNFGFNLTEDGAGDAFGVECYEDWLDENPEQWGPLLDELTREGLCLPEKASGVRDYAGITATPLSERITSDVVYLNTYRKIHHLKITLSRGNMTQAKAYLAVSRPGVSRAIFGFMQAADAAERQAGRSWSAQ